MAEFVSDFDRLSFGTLREPIVLYCEHGPRAGIARAQLWLVSDRPVRFLEGHMLVWKNGGLPVESKSDSVSAVEE